MRLFVILLALCMIAAGMGWLPFEGGNVANLSPVEIVCFSTDGEVLAVCDGGLAARGRSVTETVERLRAAAPGRLLTDTVDYVVFSGMVPDVEALAELGLRPAVGVYRAPAPVKNPDALAVYLRTHGGGVTLGMLEEDASLTVPLLVRGENDTLYIIKEGVR